MFSRSWQMVGRVEQVRDPGQYITAVVGGEPIAVVRGGDGVLRGFFNVCRHHAAAVLTEAAGCARALRCPYHGWTYTLEGALLGTPEWTGVEAFDRAANGLVPVECATWQDWVFVLPGNGGPSLESFVGADLMARVAALGLTACAGASGAGTRCRATGRCTSTTISTAGTTSRTCTRDSPPSSTIPRTRSRPGSAGACSRVRWRARRGRAATR
ncbi:MAG: Rieske (2Fe-2S) protein [Betaproteobacteria bacterium]|nr:Rieske (2Fe-2S) protein [Betaproteobacteria bacterium]